MMAMIQALQSLGFTTLLPVLGVMANDLGASGSNQRQWVIGTFLICSGLFSLVPGTISDRLGRKPVLLVCMGLFALINLLCAFVADFSVLLAARALPGGGVGPADQVLPIEPFMDRLAERGIAVHERWVAA